MMARIIKWKKFSIALMWAWSAVAIGQAPANMPKIDNVGIIPVSWQGADPGQMGLNAFRRHIDEAFGKVVRDSHRFRVLNDDLIKALWSNAEGRAELVRDYELHGFINLLATLQGDAVRLKMRLLGPDLQIYLMEEEAVGVAWANGASAAQIDEKLRDLTFRMFNRLPVDVTVMAVQGRFVTLSGGRLQGLRLGDELAIVRPSVKQVHPANGAWVEFQTSKLGQARIVDINEITAIAKLTDQSYEDAVTVGDGAKIYNIAGRVRFARLGEGNELVDHGPPTNQPLDVATPRAEPAPKAIRNEPVAQKPATQNQHVPPPAMPVSEDAPPVVEEPAEDPYDHMIGSPIAGESLTIFRGLDLYTGINTWNVSGDASAGASLAPWLLNYFAAFNRVPFSETIDLEAGGAAHLGQTKGGTYTGFDLQTKLVFLIPTQGVVSYFRVGGLGRFESLNVRSETFGGGDYLLLGGFAGAEGRVRYVDVPIEWHAEFNLLPIGIGQIGYDGSKKSLGGAMGYEFELGIVKPSDASIDWGGTIGLSSLNLDADGSFTRGGTKLLLHARYKL